MLAVGSGGFFGQGLLNGTSKYFYLPEAHTDFAFAVWAQEIGLFRRYSGRILNGHVYVFGFRIANRARDAFGRMVSHWDYDSHQWSSILQYRHGCGMLPVTGVPLPFVSYGGSSLMMNCLAIGILASIARRGVEGVKPIGTKETLPSCARKRRVGLDRIERLNLNYRDVLYHQINDNICVVYEGKL